MLLWVTLFGCRYSPFAKVIVHLYLYIFIFQMFLKESLGKKNRLTSEKGLGSGEWAGTVKRLCEPEGLPEASRLPL